MKKIIALTILGLLVYSNGFSQQQVTIHNVVTVTLPKNIEKLTKEELVALKPNTGIPSPIAHENFKGKTYTGKDFLVQLNAASTTPKPGFLEQRKREMDYLFGLALPPVYDTCIKHFQNHSVVITHYEYAGDDNGYFIFKSYNRIGDSILVATIEYDKGDKENAEKALNEIMHSIKFKKP